MSFLHAHGENKSKQNKEQKKHQVSTSGTRYIYIDQITPKVAANLLKSTNYKRRLKKKGAY
jgi:hypothetical protein